MSGFELLVFVGGLLHFLVLLAALQVPRALDWRRALAGLNPFLRRLFWVYGAFIALIIASFGVLSVAFATELVGGEPLGRAMCGMIGIFWLLRLAVQFFVFDSHLIVHRRLHKIGYHGLTVLFACLTAIYTAAAAMG